MQVFGLCKNFEIQLCFGTNPYQGALNMSMVVSLLENNLAADYPFVVTSLSLIMFAIVNYLNQNRMFVQEIFPGEIIMMMGKCFYALADEIRITDYVQHPVSLASSSKPIPEYTWEDFQIHF
jgi:hypothetical protein